MEFIKIVFGSTELAATTGSFDFPLTTFPMDDAARLAWSCFNIESLWHLEHIFIVAALPKKPQLFMHNIGPAGGA
jgi:hypothetical protein